MRNRKNNKKVYILIVLLLILSMSIGYAYLTKLLKINNTASIAKTTWDVHFENTVTSEGSIGSTTPIISEDKKTVSLTVDLANPGDYYEYTVDVVNSGTIDAMIESINITELTEEEQKYIEYIVTYDDDIKINQYDELLAGAKDTIKVVVRYKDEIATEDIHLTIENTINYVQEDENGKEREVKDLVKLMEKEAIEDTDINYGAISSDTNGKGVYKLTKIETSTPIYYYRGEVYNNNVIFGGFCWKIIRTTETRGTKLIYNGLPNEGVCDATGAATTIGLIPYNTLENDSKYVGYMYDNNTKNSTIKEAVDLWYEENLLTYQDYLEDTPFYNERDFITGTGFTYAYMPKARMYDGGLGNSTKNVTIKLGATNTSDIFTVSDKIGNGALTYPIGLITTDELIMAGGRGYISSSDNGANSTFYLNGGAAYWTLSPYDFNTGSRANMGYLNSIGWIHGTYLSSKGICARPVISLKTRTKYTKGIGTKENPFIIK